MRLQAVLRHPQGSKANFASGAAEALDRRRPGRQGVRLSAAASSPLADEIPLLVLDISEEGLLIEAEAGMLAADDYLEISLPEQGLVKAWVAWRSGRFYGCEFSTSIAPALVSAALLKGEPLAARSGADVDPRLFLASRGIKPELNFSAAFGLALALWAAIGAATYLVVW